MQKKLTSKQINTYGIYQFGSSLAAMVQMTYVTIFMTSYLMIPTALAATTLLVARIIDFLVSVVSGGIIEKAHLKHGKYRSWILYGRWIVLIGLFLTFFDTSQMPMAVRVAVSFVGYLFVNIAFGTITNAYYGLGPALAGDNMEDRVALSARGAQFMCVAMLITSACTLPLVTKLSDIVGKNSYMVVALVFAIPFIIIAEMLNRLCKDCDPDVRVDTGAGASTVTLKDMINCVVQNPQLLIVFSTYLIYYVGTYVVNGMSAYYFMYINGNYSNMTYCMTTTMITGFIASLVVPKFGAKLGKKKALIVGLIIYAFGYSMIANVAGANWIMYTCFAAISGAGVYLFSTIGVNYFVDCGEYHLYKTGKDTTIIAVAMFSVPMKVGMAVGGAIATYGLAFIGFDNVINGTLAAAEIQSKFMFLIGMVPAILVIIAVIVFAIGYKISDEDAKMYAAENMKRKMAAMK